MPPTLSHVLLDLRKGISSSTNLITKVISFGIPQIQLEMIVEMAYLRIFVSWESFLEESFIRYTTGAIPPSGNATGAIPPSGNAPVTLIHPQNIGHALDLVVAGRDYISWNSASEVIQRSALYFQDGEPYRSALEPAIIDLDEMNIIRNRIAHKSAKSKSKFNSFIRRKFGHSVRGMTPGRLLLTQHPSTAPGTFLNYYIDLLTLTSETIIPQ
jgi:hypothetical protein